MTLNVVSLKAAGKEYARMRRLRGLPPIKVALKAVAGVHGPVVVECKGVRYTLCYSNDEPCPAA